MPTGGFWRTSSATVIFSLSCTLVLWIKQGITMWLLWRTWGSPLCLPLKKHGAEQSPLPLSCLLTSQSGGTPRQVSHLTSWVEEFQPSLMWVKPMALNALENSPCPLFFFASAEYRTIVPFAVLSFTQLPLLLSFDRMVDEYFLN